MRIARRAVLVLALAAVGRPALATSIVLETGPNDVTTSFTNLNQQLSLSVAFTLGAAYSNVSIAGFFSNFFQPASANLSVYLTDQIGPGTNAGDEFANTTVNVSVPASGIFAPYTITPVTLLSGLNLSAGTYYLTIAETGSPADIWWVSSPIASASAVAAAGSGVTLPFLVSGQPVAYAPDNNFFPRTMRSGFPWTAMPR